MKKLLNTLYIMNENAYLTLDGENIVIKTDEKSARFPFANLDSIVCFSYPGCSPALIGKCCESGVGLCFISPSGRFLGRIEGRMRGNVLLRIAQSKLFSEPQYGLIRDNVAAKLANTRATVKRSLHDYPQLDSDGVLSGLTDKLDDAAERVYEMSDKAEIMGLEGNCAKAYFSVYDKLITQQRERFRMTMRTKRPPLDRTNAVLSFLYAMLTNDYASALESVGLDSYIGFYHEPRPGRCSLACDLVEEARCIVDRFVLTMINLRQINEDDFEEQVSGAVLLNEDGRKKVVRLWQEKKRSVIMHPYLKQKIPLGLLPFVQSNLLAKYIRGEISEYPAYLQK